MMRRPVRAPVRRSWTSPLTPRFSDAYSSIRQAAIDAATRNSAALWFVERDLSNVFVNADGGGGTPGANGPIGLLLPAVGRGTELFVDGDASALGTWTLTGGTVTLSEGAFRLQTSGAFGGVSRVIPTTVGAWYEFRASYRSGLGNNCTVFLRPNGADNTADQVQLPSTNSTTSMITVTRYFRATTANVFIRLTSLLNGAGDVAFFDDLSFREIQGFPLESATTSQKPMLVQAASGAPAIRFDGTDDRLRSIRSPLSSTAGNAYTLIMAGSPTSAGVRMAVCDGRGIGMGTTQWEVLHGGVARHASSVAFAQSVPRVFSATYRRTPDVLTMFMDGGQVFQAEVAPPSQVTPEAFVGARSSTGEFWVGDVFLGCMAQGVMPAADRVSIERFGALLSGAMYV